ncbi:MAG: hypothetical protein KME15_27350 [Drouetiella hepatica Uher 2000/2452]|jgi:hypothetical protein|uniref:Uncharacterized protein n=1 Tax=Drouetiella hepatica Uher 2000/2452 TaxID=904376 RepID=A0A951QGW9_9CYAN|nr:hypothetical protein [Drouetiella hepatica Uher 2000/2452]
MNDAPLDRFDAIGISGMAPLTPMQRAATTAMFLFMSAAFYLAWRWR